jgi:ankyrin repeat protein
LKSGAIEDPTTDTKNTPLHLASFNGHPEVVEVLIEYGSDVDRKRSDGWSPLHCAYGDFEVTKRLLQSGASVYTVDGVERQPLCLSAAAGSERVVNMLLDAGADKNYLDRFGRATGEAGAAFVISGRHGQADWRASDLQHHSRHQSQCSTDMEL